MPADVAPLAAGIPTVHLDECAPVPVGFVFQLADELPPANFVNGLGQRRMLHHRLHAQALDADRLVLTNEAGRELVGKITASVGTLRVDLSHLASSLVAVLGAKLLPGESPLGL